MLENTKSILPMVFIFVLTCGMLSAYSRADGPRRDFDVEKLSEKPRWNQEQELGQADGENVEKTAEQLALEAADRRQILAISETAKWAQITGRYVLAVAGENGNGGHEANLGQFHSNGETIRELLDKHVVLLYLDMNLPSFETHWKRPALKFTQPAGDRKTYINATVWLLKPNMGSVAVYECRESTPGTVLQNLFDDAGDRRPKITVEFAKTLLPIVVQGEKLAAERKYSELLLSIRPYLKHVSEGNNFDTPSKLLLRLAKLYDLAINDSKAQLAQALSGLDLNDIDDSVERALKCHEIISAFEFGTENLPGELAELANQLKSNPKFKLLVDDMALFTQIQEGGDLKLDTLEKIVPALDYEQYFDSEFVRRCRNELMNRYGVDEDWNFVISPTRIWSDRTGKFKIEGRSVAVSGDRVKILSSDGKLITAKAEQLCEADQQWHQLNKPRF